MRDAICFAWNPRGRYARASVVWLTSAVQDLYITLTHGPRHVCGSQDDSTQSCLTKMAGKPKSKQEEALALLNDLDNFAPPPPSSSGAQSAQAPPEGEAEVYAFIDEITQKSSELPRTTLSHIDRPSRAGTPTLRKSTERVRVGAAPLLPTASGSSTPLPATPLIRTESGSSRVSLTSAAKQDSRQATPPPAAPQPQPPASSSNSWGWGSLLSTASTAIQQARSVVDEQVKNLPKNEQARKWGEGVLEYAKSAQLDKLST